MSKNAFRSATTRLLLGVFVAAWVCSPSAQVATGRDTTAASVAAYALSADMPVDPEVLVGGLANGLRFYIRPNPKPAGEAEVRLVVRAGSVLEDDDQRGLAHFVEHMQFQGSRHFPGQSIEAFLGSIGLSIGSDANAVTSFDETQYLLRVPTNRPGALDTLDRALTVLEDWAGGALFEDAAIERQRAIVLAEWRRNLGADERTADKLRKVQLEGSRYADRSPIGDPAVIQKAQREQLVRFYRDWYRPDLMTVIVVGDVDQNAVTAMIRAHFSAIENPEPERPRPVFDVTEHAGSRYAVVTDKESTNTVVSLSDLRPARNQGSVGGYRDILKDQLFSQMLGDRLDERAQGERPPFLRAAASRGLFPAPKTRDQAALQALVPADGVTRGLDALVSELKRVASFGFTATELERAKQANLAVMERAAEESPDRESSSRADEYTRNFLQAEALPTIWQELAFHRRFLPEVTLAEMNALTADWFPDRNRLVIVSAPDAAGVTPPADSALDAVVSAGGAGGFSSVMLDRLLTGKAVVVQPFINETDEGMGGGSTPQDLETMFQLLHLRFTQPRADPAAFAAMSAQARGLLANQQASPDVVFNQTIDAALNRN